MKKFILIILSVSFLNSSTELHEFFRLPFLVKHYSKHRSEDHSLSFIDFLKIHYSNNHPDDDDDDDDTELPFKSQGNIVAADPITFLFIEHGEDFIFFSIERSYKSLTEGKLIKKSFSIFHPPRLS